MKALFVFCEGPHDTAFLGRLLKAFHNYAPYGGKIGDLPAPLSGFFDKRFQEELRTHQAWNLKKLHQGVKPSLDRILVHEQNDVKDTIALLFVCQGDATANDNVPFLRSVRTTMQATLGQAPKAGGTTNEVVDEYAVIFCFDADSAGVEARLSTFRTDYNAHFGGLSKLTEGSWLDTTMKEQLACIVFRAQGATTGTLEDIVEPMLAQKRSTELDAASHYLRTHAWNGSKLKGTAESDSSALETKLKKGALTTLGQFDYAGSSLAVFLEKTKLIDENDLRTNPVCQQISLIFRP